MIRDILEPDADTIASTDNMIQLSIAISLKRIADALEKANEPVIHGQSAHDAIQEALLKP